MMDREQKTRRKPDGERKSPTGSSLFGKLSVSVDLKEEDG